MEVVGPHDAHDDANGHNEEEQPHLQAAPARRAGSRSIRARGARDVVPPGAHGQSARDRASATRMAATAGKARCCSGPRQTPPWLGIGPLYDSEGPGRAVQRLWIALRRNGKAPLAGRFASGARTAICWVPRKGYGAATTTLPSTIAEPLRPGYWSRVPGTGGADSAGRFRPPSPRSESLEKDFRVVPSLQRLSGSSWRGFGPALSLWIGNSQASENEEDGAADAGREGHVGVAGVCHAHVGY